MKYLKNIAVFLFSSVFFLSAIVLPSIAQAQLSPGCYTNDEVHTRLGNVGPDGTCNQYPNAVLVGPNGRPGATVSNSLSYVPLEPLPGQSTTSSNFCQLLNLAFKFFIYLGGMVAVLFLILGGISYMVSEVVDKRSAARERIKASVWGLLLLLCSWIILNTVNPTLVNACNILNPGTTGVVSNPQSTAGDAATVQVQNAIQQCRSENGLTQAIPAGDTTRLCNALPGCHSWNPLNNIACCDVLVAPTATTIGITCSG